MAVGDVVSALSGDNAAIDLQPASSVEWLITMFGATDAICRLYDGTNFAVITPFTDDGLAYNVKMFLTNTIYARINGQGAGVHSGYCGVVWG